MRIGGDDDPMAVLDARGCVRGLRVVDAGAMPQTTSGIANSPMLMLAERAAERIATDARGRRGRSRRYCSGPSRPAAAKQVEPGWSGQMTT